MSTKQNKLADYYARFSKHSFLVVDDFSEFRLTVKAMLEGFGAVHVDTASSGEEAYQKYKKNRYDIVLSDFNLGEGKDGQQVLEELNNEGILRQDTLYIMVSAENSIAMVMGALENRPDDYLTKPFTKIALRNRLDRVFERKQALSDIYQALNKKDYEKAAQCCRQHIAAQKGHTSLCIRLLADCLLKLEKYKDAQLIVRKVLEDRELPWAMLIMAKCLYQEQDYEDAKKWCNRLFEANHQAVEALDLLSQCEWQIGSPKSAQETLQRAVDISPRNVARLRGLANLASHNEDLETELKARRTLCRLLRHSGFKKEEDFLHYTATLFNVLEQTSGLARRRLTNEIQSTIKDASQAFGESPLLKLMMQIASLRLQVVTGSAKAAISPSRKLMKFLPILSAADCIPALIWLQRLAKMLELEECISDFEEPSQDSSHSSILESERAFAWSCLKYEEYKTALAGFSRHIKLAPDEHDLLLGALQAQVALAEQGDRVALKQANSLSNTLTKLFTEDHNKTTVDKLVLRLKKLQPSS